MSGNVDRYIVFLPTGPHRFDSIEKAEAFQKLHTPKLFVTCEVCGEFFVIEGKSRRNDRIYCSEKCKLRSYRSRVRNAKTLREAGMDIGAIALQFGSDAATVTAWLKDVTPTTTGNEP